MNIRLDACLIASRAPPVFARNIVATSQPLATQAGLAHAAARRQRGRRRDRHGDRADRRRAVQQRPRLRPVRASSGTAASCTASTPRAARRRRGRRSASPAMRRDAARAAGTRSPFPARCRAGSRCRKRFGKLPFADLFAPAIRYARDGYAVSPIVAEKWANGGADPGRSPGFAEHFLPQGRAPERRRALRLARRWRASLEKIAATAARRSTAASSPQTMVAHSRSARRRAHARGLRGAHLRLGRRRSAHDYRGYTVHEIPPNGQGIAALMALGILEHFDLGSAAVDSRRRAASADRGDEARLRRRLSLRRRSAHA